MNEGARFKTTAGPGKGRVARAVEWATPYWTRGDAGRQTPADLVRVLYTGWIVAFGLKVLGASWDVSWHFKWLRDDLAPPHLLNTVGTAIVVVLTIVHWYTGYGVDRTAQRLIQWGTGVFLIAVPLDLINHRVNGLDITSWSPSHMLLYIGTAFMIAGVARGWYVSAPRGRGRPIVLGAFFLFFLENVLFPSEHQEYGILSLTAWDRGVSYAEPSLLNFAAQQMGRAVDRGMVENFTLPVSDWVYPVWYGVAAVLVLVAARKLVGLRWTATAVAAVYVAYRAVIWPLLVLGGFPPSAVPFFLVIAGICVDLAFLVPWTYARPLLGAVLTTLGVYGGLTLQDRVLEAPPFLVPTAPATAAAVAVTWLAFEWWHTRASRRGGPGQATGARVRATATP